jgi:hypothetical protein
MIISSKKNKDEYPDEVLKYVVHQRLKSGWSVRQTEWHHEEFKVPVMNAEGDLMDISHVHPNLMIATVQIQFGEEAGAAQFIKKFLHDRDREHVADCLGIHRAVVDAESPRAMMLLDEKDRR